MRRQSAFSVVAALSIPTFMAAQAHASRCAADNAGLKLPAGFCATLFADSVKGARDLVVAPNGDVFVPALGRQGGVFALRDTKRTGHADHREQFATGFQSSQVALFDGYLYAEYLPPRPAGAPNTPGSAG